MSALPEKKKVLKPSGEHQCDNCTKLIIHRLCNDHLDAKLNGAYERGMHDATGVGPPVPM